MWPELCECSSRAFSGRPLFGGSLTVELSCKPAPEAGLRPFNVPTEVYLGGDRPQGWRAPWLCKGRDKGIVSFNDLLGRAVRQALMKVCPQTPRRQRLGAAAFGGEVPLGGCWPGSRSSALRSAGRR